MASQIAPLADPLRDLNAANLAKTIFKADLPEQFVRTLPAQSLYMAIRHNGLHSSGDLVEIATIDQCRLLLDFDLWDRDEFNEEQFWEWLALSEDDNDNGLRFQQKLLKFIDLKLIALMISRHVEVETFEEPSSAPPGEGFYTPDKGHTWIGIKTEDTTHHFLLGRLLALLFETSAELFYQLLAVSSTQTASVLEEESFQERQKRLTSEGVPDMEYAAKIHAPYSDAETKEDLKGKKPDALVTDIRAVEPLIFSERSIEPLGTLLRQALFEEAFQGEFTLIMNAAIVFFGANFYEQSEVTTLASKVRGAINIGLEVAVESSSLSPLEVYRTIGLQKLYRLGVTKIIHLKKASRKISAKEKGAEVENIISCIDQRFPAFPIALSDKSEASENMRGEAMRERAFEKFSDVVKVRDLLKGLEGDPGK